MNMFYASLKNELRKLRSRKKFFVFLIIEVLMCAIWILGSLAVTKISTGAITGTIMLSYLPMNMLSFLIQVYIPLIVFMAACDLFTGEFQDGTIRATFMRPVSRFKQYMSKIVAILILGIIYLGTLLILSAVIQGLVIRSLEGIPTAFLAYGLDIVPLFILVLFAGLVNQFSGNPSLSMVLCVILYLGLSIAGILIPQMSGLMFTGYLEWHNLWLGTTVPFWAMVPKLGLLLGYALIFGAGGYYFFEKKEV